MALSWRMVSSFLLLVTVCTQCTDDESGAGGSGGRSAGGGSGGRSSGGRTQEGGSGGEAQSGAGNVPVGGVAGDGGASPGGVAGVAGDGGTSPGGNGNPGGVGSAGAGNDGSGGLPEIPPECVPWGEADGGSGTTCCWECPGGEPCRHLECGNGTVEHGCLVPFECYQVPSKGVQGPYHQEQCDDGNLDDGDGCSSLCLIEYGLNCGNGRIDENESCDDGNREPDDGCDERCQGRYWYHCDVPGKPCVEDTCGDGRRGTGQCDDGNTEPGDGCSELCDRELNWTCPPEGKCEEAYCGNGSVDEYSEDDEDGFAGAWDVGGQLIRREDCDDGNRVSGDGCSARCALEEGWECRPSDICRRPDCGDGYVFPPEEQCDDGNDEPGDGCDEDCALEPGWICQLLPAADDGAGGSGGTTGAPQPPLRRAACSRSVCGDGVVDGDEDEECDDANLRSGDGCSDECKFEGEPCTELTG
jgi:cysteine-rich repeat protein